MLHMALAVALATTSAGRAPDGPRSLLVITPKALEPGASAYAKARATDIPAECVVLEDVLATTAGADDPERLKRYLFERWSHPPAGGARLGYVLLVGDADVMPVRYMVLDRATVPAFHYAFYPSDLYYADLARDDGSFDDWNSSKDSFHAGYVGEVRGEFNKSDPINFDHISYVPEIGVGRWPVSTPAELEAASTKSLAGASGPAMGAASGVPAIGMVATGGWIENRPWMDGMAARLPEAWERRRLYFADSARNDHTPAPTAANVEELMTHLPALVLHSGHGYDDGWDRSLTVHSIPRLHNGAHPPVVFSAGCSTARLCTLPPYEAYVDVTGQAHIGTNAGEIFRAPPPPPAPYQRGAYNPGGLGERLLREGPDGAMAYIGCNTGSQPCGMTLMDGFVRAVGADPGGRLGDFWREALTFYVKEQGLATIAPTADWYPASIFFQGMKFMLYGDPSLRPFAGAEPPR